MYLSVHICLSKPLVHMKLNSELKEMGTLVHCLLRVESLGHAWTHEETCTFSLVACYSLKLFRCSLLVAKSLTTCWKICLLLITNSLVARCSLQICWLFFTCHTIGGCLLLVTYSLIARYLLQIHSLLVTLCRSRSLQKITHYLLHWNKFFSKSVHQKWIPI